MIEGKVRSGYKYVVTHMIFDIKMDSKFTHKARLVSGRNKMALPSSIAYYSVVTRESVRLTFLIAGMNNIDICASNIGSAYLNDHCGGKLWTKAGSEFGSEKGYVLLIVTALYGLKSSGAYWRENITDTLNSMGYRST